MTDSALSPWLAIGLGSAVLLYVGISLYTGKILIRVISFGPLAPNWADRRERPFEFWCYIVLHAAFGLFLVGLGLVLMLDLPLF